MSDALADQERKKYELVWSYEGYRAQADGDRIVELAWQELGCKAGDSLIDWGCGKGTPAQFFWDRGLRVTGFDIAANCLDPGIDIPFVTGCLWDELPDLLSADYSFCTDVLEHVPTPKLRKSVQNIAEHTKRAAVIQVCCTPDSWGAKIDPPQRLHLTVMPPEAWLKLLQLYWPTVRQLGIKSKHRAAFYCAT